jgi:phospholipid/cholesterol/gamma-HCH transport system permease protein
MMSLIEGWLKAQLLDVQEYIRLVARTLRASVTRPFYFHDVVEQFDYIGIGSLTVVLLTGLFTGAVLALQSGITLDQFGARSLVGRPTTSCSPRWRGTSGRVSSLCSPVTAR